MVGKKRIFLDCLGVFPMLRLKDILNYIGQKFRQIGTVYTGSLTTESVQHATSTLISQMAVPAGTYIITANFQWYLSVDCLTIVALYAPDFLGQVRGTMNSGGGDCVSGVKVLDQPTTIRLYAYQFSGSTVRVADLKFSAIRIK